MLQIPLNRTYTLAPIVVSVLLLAVFLLPETLLFQLTYERDAIQAGQWWRLLSGQFVHLSWSHLGINIAGLWVMYLLYAEHAPRWHYLVVVAVIALASNVGMYWFAADIAYYVGFSGVLYGLFAWGALIDVHKRIKFGWLLLMGIVGKVSWEYWQGPISIGPATADNLAVAAHFYGVAGGLLVAGLTIFLARLRSLKTQE